MAIRDRLWYVLVLVTVVSAAVVLALSVAEGFSLTAAGVVDRVLEHPIYWIVAFTLAWVFAPVLCKRMPLRRW